MMKSFFKNTDKICIYIETSEYYKNIKYTLEESNLATSECILDTINEETLFSSATGACELIGKGWEKEAIPITNKKKSFISGFFSKLFN